MTKKKMSDDKTKKSSFVEHLSELRSSELNCTEINYSDLLNIYMFQIC